MPVTQGSTKGGYVQRLLFLNFLINFLTAGKQAVNRGFTVFYIGQLCIRFTSTHLDSALSMFSPDNYNPKP